LVDENNYLDFEPTIYLENMNALILDEDKNLQIKTIEKPEILKEEVLVKITASALNHRELWITKGLYPGMKLPCVLGADGTGIVEEVGDSSSEQWLGKKVIIYPAYAWGENQQAPSRNFRVLGMPDHGTMADYIRVPIKNIIEKPSYLTDSEAAAIPVAGLTAWRALTRHGGMDKNSSVLITGIGGGVAQAGLSLVQAVGAKAFVTSSSKEKIEIAKSLGAYGGVDYKDPEWHNQLKELCGGIDIVLDSSPSPILDDYYRFMNYGGRIVTYGSTGAPKTTINISKFFLRHIQFIGTAMGSLKDFQEMLTFMTLHKIKPRVHSTFSFENALEAFKALQEGNQIGKIILEH